MSTAHAPSVTSVTATGDMAIARSRSTLGVEALIAQASAQRETALLGQTLSPLFPESCPWTAVAEVPEKSANRLQHQLSAVTTAVLDYRTALTATAGQLATWLDASEEDVRELALEFAQRRLPGSAKLTWAERVLRAPVPGDSQATQLARINDARFWRRAIRVLLLREREHFFLRLRLVGKSAEPYVSDVQLSARRAQLKRQAQWMKETVLVPRYLAPGDATDNLLTLEQVASSPRTRFAKLYAFVKAMDAISIERGLATGMLTLTLEPEWHPNPSHGVNSWNGASPRAAHQSMGTRWQSVLRDLDRLNIGVSGLRVVEPHKDGCPHWHLWLLYRPAAEQSILQTVIKYFPNKLKVRNPRAKGSKSTAGDVIFDSLCALKASASRAPTHAKEGAQVELARIDRSISSGASYAMKYLLKTVDGGDAINAEAGLFTPTPSAATDTVAQAGLFAELQSGPGKKPKQPSAKQLAEFQDKRAKHAATAKRVDAYRSLWGINAGQLFGVAKCLTAWDELRRLADAPKHPLLKKLWALARGSDKEGRIGAGEAIRGDAQGFIQALGGLAACGKAPKGVASVSIGRLTEEALNSYGETIDRTKGVTLVKRTREKVETGSRVNKSTGEIKPVLAWRSVQTVLASIKTRLGEWVMVMKQKMTKKEKEAGKVDMRVQAAVSLAEQRFMAQLNEDSPAHLGVLAVRAFWSDLWDAMALEPAEPDTAPPLPWLLATA
jgi:hypothetical protein